MPFFLTVTNNLLSLFPKVFLVSFGRAVLNAFTSSIISATSYSYFLASKADSTLARASSKYYSCFRSKAEVPASSSTKSRRSYNHHETRFCRFQRKVRINVSKSEKCILRLQYQIQSYRIRLPFSLLQHEGFLFLSA